MGTGKAVASRGVRRADAARVTSDNTLYYGDNLDVLRRHIEDESVDLVYLDPPFNSNRNYNVIFAEKDGTRPAAQTKAFGDTWEWNEEAERAYQQIVENGGKVSQAMQAFRTFLGTNDMLAYLAMMAPRLVDLRRALRPTGTLWLHCDPTASHYLKTLLDAVFGGQQFLNEIVWKRSSAHSDTKQGMRRCGRIHDVILAYAKTDAYKWNPVYTPYSPDYLESEYRHETPDGRRRYKETDLTAAKPGGDTSFEWHVKRPAEAPPGVRWVADVDDEYKTPKAGWVYRGVLPYSGRFWAYTKKNLIEFWNQSRIIHRETGIPRLMHFADEMPGVSLQDLWDDIPPVSGAEDLGYPTQKPSELLERIIRAGTDEGDVVLDPFCGCGTAVGASQRLGRRWVGIDITHLAVALIKHRLASAFGESVAGTYKVVGEPVDLSGAAELAATDPYQFQWWVLSLIYARPVEQKKGADKGIDGRLYFHDEGDSAKTKSVIFSVKAGGTGVAHLRDLRGVLDREKAAIGVLVTLDEPTKPMKVEAASAGFYKAAFGKAQFPRLQLLTVEDLLNGGRVQMPGWHEARTFRRAPKAKGKPHTQAALPFGGE